MNTQLIDAATVDKAAAVDRLIKGGAKMEVKNWVRAQCASGISVMGRGARLFLKYACQYARAHMYHTCSISVVPF